jgi:hypothetical protein
MGEAEMMQIEFESARVCKGILSGDMVLVESFIRTEPTEHLHFVHNKVVNELSTAIYTDGLDVIKKKELKALKLRYEELYSDVSKFNYEMLKIDRVLSGYPKYQATMALYGKDPQPYHEWVELMASLTAVR